MALALFSRKNDPEFSTKISEQKLGSINFTVYKNNNRRKPDKKDRILIVSCFSEFGCETIGCMYCIPRLLKRYPGHYVIAMGWYGREYLYRHLVDEYWEIDESAMWLREYTRAFHHISDNLKKLEEAASLYGTVFPASALGKYAVGNFCQTCGKFWNEWRKQDTCCPSCKSSVIIKSMFSDPEYYKKQARWIPRPRPEYMEWAKQLLKPNTVGLFARGRKAYGRNLTPEFYKDLIAQIESLGHNVIWLGEKQSTQPCPVDHVLDFSRLPESRELERTLAIVSQLSFTVQFWTASSRLAGMMGTPFLLFESPEQIYCSGLNPAQEGKRLVLASRGEYKLVIAHYLTAMSDPDKVLRLAVRAMKEMKDGNYDQIIGMVESHDGIRLLQHEHESMMKKPFEWQKLQGATGNV